MSTREDGEPLHTVLAAAQVIDPGFTEVTLKKWRDGGLVPRPEARPGRGRKSDKQGGRAAIYPAGTIAQLERLLALRTAAREAGRRFRPEQALWDVWWTGGYGRSSAIQAQLSGQVGALADFATAVRSQTDTEHDAPTGMTVYDEVARGKLGSELAGAQTRTGKRAFPSLLYFLINLAQGSFAGFTDDDPTGHRRKSTDLTDVQIFDRGTGLDRARQDRLDAADPWLQGPLASPLQGLAALISPVAVDEALEATADDELARARDELQALIGIFFSLRLTLEATHGPGAFGLAGALHPNDLDATAQQRLLLWWLAFRRRPELRDGFQVITTTAGTVAPLETFIDLTRSAASRELPRRLSPEQLLASQKGDAQ